MAAAALSGKVIGWLVGGVARSAIGQAGMIEGGRFPRGGRMAGTALSRKVIGRLIGSVARRAIRLAGMIEVGRLPRR